MEELITTYEELLERVDEYSLYCFYLGFAPELDVSYRSPVRPDDLHPSWDLYLSKYRKNVEFMWKDKGGGGISGDIWGLIKRLYGLRTVSQVLARVKADFGLGPAAEGARIQVVTDPRPTPSPKVDIRVKSRDFDRFDLNWWKAVGVDRNILDRFHTTRIRYYFKYIDQEVPCTPRDRGYAYRIMGKYQLYFPFDRKQDKFRSELSDRELMGFEQLAYRSPLLIITKSMKDVMCLTSFGYESVATRGESMMVPVEFLTHLRGQYQRILLLYDNDMKHNGGQYPEEKIYIPPSSGTKDVSDFCRKYGPQQTATLLNQLTHGYKEHDKSPDRGSTGREVPW